MPLSMSDDRLSVALDRLEQALARVEEAGADLDLVAGTQAAARESLQARLDALDARHRKLRTSAAAAIEQLDGLIAPAEARRG